MRHIAMILLPFLAYGALSWMGCSDDETTGGTGGATSTPSSSSSSSTSSSSLPPVCDGPPDQLCDIATEGCDCPDCAPTAYCVADLCTDDGTCDPYDSCVCPDCDRDPYCADPADTNCEQDGQCDSYFEGCNCYDCYDHDECLDNVAACSGGAPNEQCDAPSEDCSCTDCLGAVACVPCELDGSCAVDEPCFCDDCADQAFCQDEDACEDDEICAPLYEGCDCADCQIIVPCGGPGVGGSGAGGSG